MSYQFHIEMLTELIHLHRYYLRYLNNLYFFFFDHRYLFLLTDKEANFILNIFSSSHSIVFSHVQRIYVFRG